MADGEGVTIFISPKWSEEALKALYEKLCEIFGEGVPITFKKKDDGELSSGGDTAKEAEEGSNTLKSTFKEYIKENKRDLTVKAIKGTEQAISSSLKKGFGIVEDIYGRLKAASPLLQAIESLFNLAMTLFFLPLGNKLGEILIPATLELVDKVVDLWDKFEGKSLGEMFDIAISTGVKLFGEYFVSIGDELKEQGGLLGGIGELLTTVGNFIQGPGIAVLNTILNVTSFVLGHLKEFITLWIALKTAELAMQATGALGWVGANAAIFTAVAALVAGGVAYGGMTLYGMAEGGRVPATPGGTLRLLGEGGEDEYVVPESKLGNISGGSITYNIYGYTDSELKTIINDTVNEQISQSRIRSGFRWPRAGPAN